ncbi:DUF488 family protein [Corynebacterium diphtheriae]|uniref:DUF488 domain-containing protein n=1 Tax=Corynebacterium diphtheriae TaxID=1717 RepID=UPI000A1E5086|nr:DUF488 domain-containing protein [Corynebacterium diphtheriae]OSQ00064.1 hypothetical protein B1A65_08355 [Corynebacterium diphtheriae]OSQ19790.1 hypothetical protein B1A51_11690 [Corynebacterium diphtheriae]RKW98448.1 DUF488 domain-containing protein [Corynebacterium diphtheriae]RKX00397.1 DUF488 domain-containing protein [Corynebacterium diphtheriae]CAB0567126.1 hypothetical protein CIP107512_01914 [Corynebacterium diphtheriae]
MQIYTLGFSHKSAEEFFDILRESGVRRVVDIRRSNTNQLAGFTKKDDLRYFLRVILDMPYTHELALAPSADLMHAYRHDEVGFDEFSKQLREEYDAGEVSSLDRSLFDDAVLLCSEADPSTCHRLVAAEYLAEVWDDVEIEHL